MRISDWSSYVCSSDLILDASKSIDTRSNIKRTLNDLRKWAVLISAIGLCMTCDPRDTIMVSLKLGPAVYLLGLFSFLSRAPTANFIGKGEPLARLGRLDRKSTRLNSSH